MYNMHFQLSIHTSLLSAELITVALLFTLVNNNYYYYFHGLDL